MALEKSKEFCLRESKQSSENFKNKMKRDKNFQTKVVIRRLPPSMTEEQFVEQLSPIPDYDYMYFVKADMRLGPHAFSRAYINFHHPENIFIFKDKFDGYVFLDNKGNEYPAIVEFAPFQKTPKKRNKKRDSKCGTISTDPDYLKFLENLKNPEELVLPSAEIYLEEIESREKELKANNGVLKTTTPLIEYLKARKIEQQKMREEKREERRRKELEKKRMREEERRRRKTEKDRTKDKFKDKESFSEKEILDNIDESSASENFKQVEPIVQVLKNPEREKDQKDIIVSPRSKEYFPSSKIIKDKEKFKKEWERTYPKDKPKLIYERMTYVRDKDRSRRDKTEKIFIGKKAENNILELYDESKESNTEIGKLIQSNADKTSQQDMKETTLNTQWSSKDKRDNSCPGNVETTTSNEESKNLNAEDNLENNDNSKSDSNCVDYREQNKDPRVERRIRNKDRPSLEIYRPGMRRFNTQRNSPQKEISTSASNSSSPSPTPPLTIGVNKSQSQDNEKHKTITATK